jgi:pimeloyl-ACP methyl ester carboxylesterase
MVAEGRGKDLFLLPGWWYVTSAASFVDALENCPDILELAARIRCPILYVRGDQEPRELYPAEAFAGRAAGPCSVEIVPECGHFYAGREDAVSTIVCSWLANALKRG